VHKATILLVDDEQLILDSFGKFLAKEGYRVLSCLSGAGAIRMMKTESVDLAMLDVLMPDMSGIDLARKIRKNPKTEGLDIIFVTVMAQAGEEVRVAMEEIKPLDWLQKPVDIPKLREVLQNALENQK
jgi:DNA-binding response OmpR family regulator